MTLPPYPRTDKAAVAYAAELAKLHGKPYHAVRIPKEGNPHGITHAAVTADELPEYLAADCTEIKP